MNLTEWIAILIIAVIAALFELRPISLPSGEDLSFVSPLLFIPSILFGFFPVACIVFIFCLILVVTKPSAWKPIAFNGVQYALSAYVALGIYQLAGGQIGSLNLNNVLSYSAYIFFYHIMNLIFVNFYTYIRNRSFISLDLRSMVVYFNLMAFGTLVTKVIEIDGLIGLVLFTIVLWGLGISYRTYYKMYNDFKLLSIKDGLTNLYNHRFFQQKIHEIVLSEKECCLLLLDLDNFKVYNDKLGHPQGDILLRDISTLLLENAPKNAYVCRYGGEEFAIILPGVKRENGMKLAEKIRLSIFQSDFYGAENMPLNRITVSIGVSVYPQVKTKEQLIKASDMALYEAKKSRNTVASFSA